MTFKQVLEEASSSWINLPGVEGVAQGESHGKDCIVVYISSPVEQLKGKVPETFHDFKVVFEPTDNFNTQPL